MPTNTKNVGFRVSPREYADIIEAAERYGLEPMTWLRLLARREANHGIEQMHDSDWTLLGLAAHLRESHPQIGGADKRANVPVDELLDWRLEDLMVIHDRYHRHSTLKKHGPLEGENVA